MKLKLGVKGMKEGDKFKSKPNLYYNFLLHIVHLLGVIQFVLHVSVCEMAP